MTQCFLVVFHLNLHPEGFSPRKASKLPDCFSPQSPPGRLLTPKGLKASWTHFPSFASGTPSWPDFSDRRPDFGAHRPNFDAWPDLGIRRPTAWKSLVPYQADSSSSKERRFRGALSVLLFPGQGSLILLRHMADRRLYNFERGQPELRITGQHLNGDLVISRFSQVPLQISIKLTVVYHAVPL